MRMYHAQTSPCPLCPLPYNTKGKRRVSTWPLHRWVLVALEGWPLPCQLPLYAGTPWSVCLPCSLSYHAALSAEHPMGCDNQATGCHHTHIVRCFLAADHAV